MIFRPLDAETFAAFGSVIVCPATPGRTARLALPANLRPGANPTLTLIHLDAAAPPVVIDRMERHRHAGQAFLHMGGGSLLVVVAPTSADGGPDLSDVTAFVSAPGQGFAYHPDVWHAGVSAHTLPAMVASLLPCDGTDGDVEVLMLDQTFAL